MFDSLVSSSVLLLLLFLYPSLEAAVVCWLFSHSLTQAAYIKELKCAVINAMIEALLVCTDMSYL